jgi:hypothetical protein
VGSGKEAWAGRVSDSAPSPTERLAELRRTHAWEDVTDDPLALLAFVTGDVVREEFRVTVRRLDGRGYERRVAVKVLASGAVVVGESTFGGDALPPRTYILRPLA